MNMLRDLPIDGIAHITGGGITDNVVRVLPDSCMVKVKENSWEVLPIFDYIKNVGNVEDSEMKRTFNNGIGLVVVVSDISVNDVMQRLKALNEKAYVIGEVCKRENTNNTQIEWIK